MLKNKNVKLALIGVGVAAGITLFMYLSFKVAARDKKLNH